MKIISLLVALIPFLAHGFVLPRTSLIGNGFLSFDVKKSLPRHRYQQPITQVNNVLILQEAQGNNDDKAKKEEPPLSSAYRVSSFDILGKNIEGNRVNIASDELGATAAKDSTETTTNNIVNLQKSSQVIIQQLKNKSQRKQLFSDFFLDMKTVFVSLLTNIRHGEYGKRGEEIVFIQLTLLGFIFFGMNSFLTIGIRVLSLSAFFYGHSLLFRGILDLKNNFSPYIDPGKNHTLVTTGIYEQVRHPIYGGLLLLALGVSIIAKDVYKLFVTILLGVILVCPQNTICLFFLVSLI